MERNQCFTTGKHISDTKGNMHSLSKERRCPVPKQQLCKNSLWLEWPGDQKSYSLGEEVVIFDMPEEVVPGPFLPQSPRLMLEPPTGPSTPATSHSFA